MLLVVVDVDVDVMVVVVRHERVNLCDSRLLILSASSAIVDFSCCCFVVVMTGRGTIIKLSPHNCRRSVDFLVMQIPCTVPFMI